MDVEIRMDSNFGGGTRQLLQCEISRSKTARPSDAVVAYENAQFYFFTAKALGSI
jgi:hypothetical protein